MENNNMENIDRETLSAILKEHQLWIDSNGENGERADLSNKNLREANLIGANLIGANLRGSKFKYSIYGEFWLIYK